MIALTLDPVRKNLGRRVNLL